MRNFFQKLIHTKYGPKLIAAGIITGLIGTCLLALYLFDIFSRMQFKNEDNKIAEFQWKMAGYCEAAKSKQVTPHEFHTPVFGYLMKGDEYFGDDSFLELQYREVERWIGNYGSKTPMYAAKTVLCVDADDLNGATCSYSEEGGGGGLLITLRRQNFHVYLIDMETGNLLGKETFTGGDPGECDPTLFVSKNNGFEAQYTGETISADDVLNWIKTLPTK